MNRELTANSKQIENLREELEALKKFTVNQFKDHESVVRGLIEQINLLKQDVPVGLSAYKAWDNKEDEYWNQFKHDQEHNEKVNNDFFSELKEMEEESMKAAEEQAVKDLAEGVKDVLEGNVKAFGEDCIYCNFDDSWNLTIKDFSFSIGKGEGAFKHQDQVYVILNPEPTKENKFKCHKFQYCPICGRKLE